MPLSGAQRVSSNIDETNHQVPLHFHRKEYVHHALDHHTIQYTLFPTASKSLEALSATGSSRCFKIPKAVHEGAIETFNADYLSSSRGYSCNNNIHRASVSSIIRIKRGGESVIPVHKR